jgi:hypothetical protein
MPEARAAGNGALAAHRSAHARRWGLDAPAWLRLSSRSTRRYTPAMHYDAHQPIINDLAARILTIRDSL